MGAEHPVSWWHAYENGCVFVMTLGHNAETYRERRYLDHLWGGVWWAATGLGQHGQR